MSEKLSGKRALLFIAAFIVFFVIGLLIGGGEEEQPKVKRMLPSLGTVVEIIIPEGEPAIQKGAFEAAFAEIGRIDSVFTDYNDSSAVGLINLAEPGNVKTSPEVLALVKRSLEFSEKTRGAFDVTVGGLVRLWGFKDETMHIPSKDSLAAVRKMVGFKNLAVTGESSLEKKTGLKIDLSGIAKGYAVDRAFDVLNKLGVKSFLINAGGEIRCKGEGWTTGVQDPRDPNGMAEVILPGERAVATSGDYQNYFEVDGTRYCHLFDPSTGFPAEKVASVTVIAGDVATADALATALFVAGLETSDTIMKNFPGCEYLIIGKDGKKHYSPGFKKYIRS